MWIGLSLSAAAPAPNGSGDFGYISCPPPTDPASAITVLAIFALLALIIPFHTGTHWAARRNRAPSVIGAGAGILLAIPAVVAAFLYLRESYTIGSFLAWAATITYSFAALSFVAGYRAGSSQAPPALSYASLGLALGSVLLFTIGWPLSVALAASLMISAAMGPRLRDPLDLPVSGAHFGFALMAGFADLLLVFGDEPTFVGGW